jgi:hypothetical protein
LFCAGCEANVDLGFNRQALGDGGEDAGALDASVAPDGGELDAGSTDAGSTGDGGASDAGTPDAGVGDGGPPDLTLQLSMNQVSEQGVLSTLTVLVQNLGGSTAQQTSVRLALPSTLTWASGCQLVDAGLVDCSLGDVVTTASTTLDVLPSAVRGVERLRGQVSTVTPELDTANNDFEARTCITAIAAAPVPITPVRNATLEACFGVGLTSFSQCTPPGTLTGSFDLLTDGGTDTIDAGYSGRWAQSPSRRNVGLEFYNPFVLPFDVSYCGAATTATCFEGIADDTNMNGVGVFRLCLN